MPGKPTPSRWPTLGPDLASDKRYTETQEWLKGLRVGSTPNEKYLPVYEYAQERLSEIQTIHANENKKAEQVMAFTFTAATLLSAADFFDGGMAILVRIAVVLLFFSALCATWARIFGRLPTPESARKMLAVSRNEKLSKDGYYALMAGSLHLAFVAIEILAEWKQRRVCAAYLAGVTSVLLLAIQLLIS